MTTVLLIRHGESEANRKSVFAGQIDPALLEQGVIQAKTTAEFVAENYQVDAIYASDLSRAYETAKILADRLGLEVVKNTAFREINAGRWENVFFGDLQTVSPESFEDWTTRIGHSVCPDGESVKQVGERVMAELTRLAGEHDGQTIAVGTHATPIRAFESLVTTGDLEEMQNIPWVSNASVSVYEYENNTWRLVAPSLDAHLGKLKTVLPGNL